MTSTRARIKKIIHVATDIVESMHKRLQLTHFARARKAERSSGEGQDKRLHKKRKQMPWYFARAHMYFWRKIFTRLVDSGNRNRKGVYLILMILIFLNFVGSISVVGLLLSKENIRTSGLIVIPQTAVSPPSSSPPIPPPPEPRIDLDIYGEIECINKKATIGWGSVKIGGSISEIVYIENTGDAAVSLSFITENWDPIGASEYMELSWNYDGSPIKAGYAVGITLTLTVDSSITGVKNFSFDIVFIASAA